MRTVRSALYHFTEEEGHNKRHDQPWLSGCRAFYGDWNLEVTPGDGVYGSKNDPQTPSLGTKTEGENNEKGI